MNILGHYALLKESSIQAYKSPIDSNNNSYFISVEHELMHIFLYSTAVSKLMTKGNSLTFDELKQCIHSEKAPMIIVLNIKYSGCTSRRHLIGIVPSLMIDNKTEMHIVDGYHPDKKSLTLNE